MHSIIQFFTHAKLFVEVFALPLGFVAVGVGMIVLMRLARAAHCTGAAHRSTAYRNAAASHANATPKQKRFQIQFGIGFLS